MSASIDKNAVSTYSIDPQFIFNQPYRVIVVTRENKIFRIKLYFQMSPMILNKHRYQMPLVSASADTAIGTNRTSESNGPQLSTSMKGWMEGDLWARYQFTYCNGHTEKKHIIKQSENNKVSLWFFLLRVHPYYYIIQKKNRFNKTEKKDF